jgi:hypothetical protein
MYNSTLSLTSVVDVVGGQRDALVALTAGYRPGTHCTGVLVGHRAGMNGAENLSATGIRSPDRPVRSELLYRLSCVYVKLRVQSRKGESCCSINHSSFYS